MPADTSRRSFVRSALVPAVLGAAAQVSAQAPIVRPAGSNVKLSCNIYSFNGPLTRGEMSLEEVFEFCAKVGFAAVDPTAYYLRTYPETPPDEYVYGLKRKAFLMGLDISGTGVRNDFTQADPRRRQADEQLVAKWVDCAAKLGAPVLRVFSGEGVPTGHSADEVYRWVSESLKRCALAGGSRGVMVAMQNHADLMQQADDILKILRMVDSDWFGIDLDIGSFRTRDPYEDIARVAPYAVTWQIKEYLVLNGKETRTDLKRIASIFRESGYRGYIPLETLGQGDPKAKLTRFLDEVRSAL